MHRDADDARAVLLVPGQKPAHPRADSPTKAAC
jgi:hypothetical protein